MRTGWWKENRARNVYTQEEKERENERHML
jgi:hypothetical protein